jgi:hypothetical protein
VDPRGLRSIVLKNGLVRISRSPRWRRTSRNFTFTDRCEQAQIVAWEREGIEYAIERSSLEHQWVSKAPVPHGVLTEDACRMGVASAVFSGYQK